METQARKIVNAVIKNLKNRKGFGNWYDNIDGDIQEELKNKLEEVITKQLK